LGQSSETSKGSLDALGSQALALIRQHNLAYDRKLRAPTKVFSISIVVILVTLILQTWLTPEDVLLLLPINFKAASVECASQSSVRRDT
jgi:hypothetical protein